jgi:hypothetical protein
MKNLLIKKKFLPKNKEKISQGKDKFTPKVFLENSYLFSSSPEDGTKVSKA